MKLIALLSWYDEPAAWLAETIGSLAQLGVTDVVAVDGAYALFPDAQPRSTLSECNAIMWACATHRMGCTIHAPSAPWVGGEVEKRTRMFELALAGATTADWLIVIDADERVTHGHDLRPELAATDLDAAKVTLTERGMAQQQRRLYRALPGLHCERNHYTYVTGGGRKLWGNETAGEYVEPCLDLTGVRIDHLRHERSERRQDAKRAYYAERDRLGIERGGCARCDRQATTTKPYGFELGPHGLESGWLECCADCAPAVDAMNRVDVLQARDLVRRDGRDLDLSGLYASVPGLEAAT